MRFNLHLLLFSYFSFAQTNFEGIIKWNIEEVPPKGSTETSLGLTDKDKTELNKSIAQLESQLKDPKMKAKFDKDPSMKAKMEARLQEMKDLKNYEVDYSKPQLRITKMKAGNLSTMSEDGRMERNYIQLYQKKTNATFYLDTDKKTYSKEIIETPKDFDSVIVKVTPASVTKTILNYSCEKYIITFSDKGEVVLINIWVTKEMPAIDITWFYNTIMIGNDARLKAFNQIGGTLLAIEIFEHGYIIRSEVTEIKPATILDADFIIPVDYKEVPFGQ